MDVHVRSQFQGEVSVHIPDDAASTSNGDDNTLGDQFSKNRGKSPGCLPDTRTKDTLAIYPVEGQNGRDGKDTERF